MSDLVNSNIDLSKVTLDSLNANNREFLMKLAKEAQEEEEKKNKEIFDNHAKNYFGMTSNQAKKRVKFASDILEYFGVKAKDDTKVEALKVCLMSDEVKKAVNDIAMKKSKDKSAQSSNPVPSSSSVSSSSAQAVEQKIPPR